MSEKSRQIIEKLELKRKIELIAKLGSASNVPEEGIPAVRISNYDRQVHEQGDAYPCYQAMASSWNDALNGAVFADVAKRAAKNGVNVVLTPRSGVRIAPYVNGVSEDPQLCSQLANSYVKALSANGVLPVINNEFTQMEVDYLDNKKNDRAVMEYFIQPYRDVKSPGFAFSCAPLAGEYANLNAVTLSNYFTKSAVRDEGYSICTDLGNSSMIKRVKAGNLMLDGDEGELESAVEAFNELREHCEQDGDDSKLIEMEKANKVISPFVIDKAAEKAVDFAFAVNDLPQSDGTLDSGATALSIAEQSVVLLKNAKNILPLKGKKRWAIIGIPGQNFTAEQLCNVVNASGNYGAQYADGYAYSGEPDEQLVSEAVCLAKASDVTVLFLGVSDSATVAKMHGERISRLPLNQLALLDKIKSLKKPVVAILSGRDCYDTSFDASVQALMLCPDYTAYSPQALFNLLSGAVSPSGRLTSTYYTATDDYFDNFRHATKNGKNKVGTLIGYRRYDTAGVAVKYPFGYGLSYTQFRYDKLKISDRIISFRVTNIGSYDGYEVAQLYVGKDKPAVIRPKKELKGYAKIFLKRGSSQIVNIKIKKGCLDVFVGGKFVTERGRYDVYVGGNVSDTPLRGVMRLAGEALKNNGEKLNDYLQTESNVLSGGYTVAPVKKNKHGKGCITAGKTFIIIAAIALVAFAALFYTEILDFTALSNMIIALSATGAPLLLSVIFFIVGGAKRAKGKKLTAPISEGVAPEGSEPLPRSSYEELFDSLYGEENEELPHAVVTRRKHLFAKKQQTNLIRVFKPDVEFTFDKIIAQLTVFMMESGVTASTAYLRRLLACIASAKVLIVRGEEQKAVKLFTALSEYFGSNLTVSECMSGEHCNVANTLAALDNEDEETVKFVLIKNADLTETAKNIAPMLMHGDVTSASRVATDHGTERESVTIAPNIKTVLLVNSDEQLKCAENSLLDAAAYIEVVFADGQEVEQKSEFIKVTFSQIYGLQDRNTRLTDKYTLNEERYWKKLDRIEKYLSDNGGFTIGNRLCLAIEQFVACYLATGDDEGIMDALISCRIALSAANSVTQDVGDEGGLIARLDATFSEQTLEETKKVLHGFAHGIA